MNQKQRILTPRVVIRVIFFVVIAPFLPLLISRQWDWWEAWVYALITILGFIISRMLVRRRNPDLIAERAHYTEQPDAKAWDKILSPSLVLIGALIPLVAGLDALYGWSQPFSLAVTLIALALFLAGYALSSYALIENRFFSGMVRIQTERSHQVVSSGPYRWLRHPGYAGALLTYVATPFFLDSIWALLPAVVLTVVLVIRTSLEDRTLKEELPGYSEYTGRVRYRLLPGVW